LTPAQVALLSDAIDDVCAQRRRALESALDNLVPGLPLAGVLRIVRSGRR
jgi:hypothetical protein